MPIAFKSKLSSSITNQTFLDKTIDDIKKGKLTLYKVNIGDADTIDDVQNYINELADTIGQNGEGDANRKIYSSNNYISNSDSHKTAIEALDVQAKANQDIDDAQDLTIADHETRITANTRSVNLLTLADASQVTLSLTKYTQFLKVVGDSAPVTLNSLPFTDTDVPVDCSIIHIIGQDDANTVKLTFNDVDYGCLLNGDATLAKGNVLTLIYDGTLLRYIEQSRNF